MGAGSRTASGGPSHLRFRVARCEFALNRRAHRTPLELHGGGRRHRVETLLGEHGAALVLWEWEWGQAAGAAGQAGRKRGEGEDRGRRDETEKETGTRVQRKGNETHARQGGGAKRRASREVD